MKQTSRLLAGAAAIAALALSGHSAQATHIDELGIDISVFSSDGTGNFTLRYDQYFGADGAKWNGSDWSGYDEPYDTSLSINIASGPGSLTGSTNVVLEFQGLVDEFGDPLPGFGPSQFNDNGNGDTDAGQFSDFLDFTIDGFDTGATYLVDVEADDCCFVSGGGGPSFDGQLQFDPSDVVNPDEIPEPATLGLFGIGLAGLGFAAWRRRA